MPRGIGTPPYVRRLAQLNRTKGTLSERLLWGRLRRRAFHDIWFKRQEPMGRYIADFCAPNEKLVIEIDGAVHADTKEYDAIRDDWLSSLGFQILRVSTDDVETNIDHVLAQIHAAVERQRARTHSPGGVARP